MRKGTMTFQPHNAQKFRVHGFRARMATKGGRKVLAARLKFDRHSRRRTMGLSDDDPFLFRFVCALEII